MGSELGVVIGWERADLTCLIESLNEGGALTRNNTSLNPAEGGPRNNIIIQCKELGEVQLGLTDAGATWAGEAEAFES